MRHARCIGILAAAIALAGSARRGAAQGPEMLPPVASMPAQGFSLSLEEAKQRALQNSKVLDLAKLNVQSKGYATSATRADYFPKIIGSVVYFHYDSPLGSVFTTRGGLSVPVNIINQNQVFTTVGVVQPITALLKVRAGVRIGEADQAIAHSQSEQAMRAVAVGTEQLYWGLLAVQQIRAGAATAVQGAQMAAQTGHPDALTALVEARQGEAEATNQTVDLQEQLWILLDFPVGTQFTLVEPPLPSFSFGSADDAVALAELHSPEVREAAQNVCKAQAAVSAAKVDYLPNVNVISGYANQNGIPAIQQNIGYVGVQGSHTFFEWGKRHHTMNERETVVAMAQLKMRQTQDEVRQKTLKAFRELQHTSGALGLAQQMAQLRADAQRRAADPATQAAAIKARMLADVEVVKATMNYRVAAAELVSITACQGAPAAVAARPVVRK